MPATFPDLVLLPGKQFTFSDAAFPGVRIVFGINRFPYGVVEGDPVLAREEFSQLLAVGAQSYGFEDRYAGDEPPYSIEFTGADPPITATVALWGTGVASTFVMNYADAGRFNTTPLGDNYLRAGIRSAVGGFKVTLSRPVSAFGFYATDIGDFTALCLLNVSLGAGGIVETMLPIPSGAQDGNLVFWGVVSSNPAVTFTQFEFGASYPEGGGTVTDYFGFDDFVAADAASAPMNLVATRGVGENSRVLTIKMVPAGA